MKMAGVVAVALLMLMSLTGIASAEEKMVQVEKFGYVTQDTADVLEILKKRRAKAMETEVRKETPAMVKNMKAESAPAVQISKQGSEDPISKIISSYTSEPAKPVKDEMKEEKYFKHTFDEYTAYAGGWYAMDAKSKGIWALGEWVHWGTNMEDPQNFGAGITIKGDYGWAKQDGVHWGYIAPGINLDYYRGLTEQDDILIKLRPMYRFGEKISGTGFMPGAYLQYAHILGRNDKIIASADGTYFRNDSYLGIGLMWEHRFNRDFKMRFGPFAGFNFLKEETIFGLGPAVVFDFYNRFEIGLSANFAKGGPFLGAFAGYKINTDLRAIDASMREKSVKMEEKGSATKMVTDNVMVEKTATGDYSILPDADQIIISDKTLDEEGGK